MATQVPAKRNRTPWIIVGVMGCLALCLFSVLVVGGLYAVVSRTQSTPVARELPTMIAPTTSMPLATTVARPSPVAGGLPTMIAPATPLPLATTVAKPSPSAMPNTSRVGRIAYIASDPTGDPFKKDAIYLMNADGSQRTLVTDKLSVSNNLLWSPDGARMVFDARDDTNISSIYVVNADGTGLNRLTNCSPMRCASPSWSPDGKQIAFQFDFFEPGKPLQGPKLYLMNPDGSQQTLLAGNTGGIIRQIAWSPDGTRVALQDSLRCIRIVTIDGSVSRPLTGCSGAEDAQYPAWSTDSKQIAFLYKRQSGDAFALYVMNADGSQQTRLAADLKLVGSPAVWSPDGKRIAFGYIGKNQEGAIGLINPDGSGMLRLTPEDMNTGGPAWSPDGKQIAFSVTTQKPMKSDIFVMNADGSGITRLTKDPLSAHSPAWQPISR